MNKQSQWLLEAPFVSDKNPYANGENSSPLSKPNQKFMYVQTHEDTQTQKLGQWSQIVDQAIRKAEKQMQYHYDHREKYAAGAGKNNDGKVACKEEMKYWI